MDKITPCLWSNHKAEEQANYYVSLLPDSRIDQMLRWPMDGSGPNAGAKKGDVLAVDFTVAGRSFMLLNGGSQFPYTEATSMSVDCKDQAEVDRLWDKLIGDGGTPVACSWLKDKYGLSWQIVPHRLYELIHDKDTAKAARVMGAMMQMVKIDVATLEKAAKG
jgi:predicted 3-demethylubiquinone-9 3-methyltransferase (glyoxalase superfamily)